MAIPALWFAWMTCVMSRVFAQAGAQAPPSGLENSGLSWGVMGTGAAVVMATIGKTVTEYLQFRREQEQTSEKAKYVQEMALLTAEKDDEKERADREKLRADQAEARFEALKTSHERLRDSYEDLRIKHALATGKEPPSSSQLGWAGPPPALPEKPQ